MQWNVPGTGVIRRLLMVKDKCLDAIPLPGESAESRPYDCTVAIDSNLRATSEAARVPKRGASLDLSGVFGRRAQ